MTSLRWGDLQSTAHGYTVDLCSGDTPVATLHHDRDTDYMVVGDQSWAITGDPATGLSFTLPDGRVFVARGEKKRIGRAGVIGADCASHVYRLVNEVSSDWIIDDASNRKVAQFTGAGHGVRHVVLEREDHNPIPDDHAIFLAFIARAALENKLLSMTTVFTICLALLAPFTAIVLLMR